MTRGRVEEAREEETVMERRLEGWPALAKALHWGIALAVAAQLVTGVVMTTRGNDLGIWDALTNTLYSSHKLIGFLILWFAAFRVLRRLFGRVPAPDRTLPGWQQTIASVNHVALYALLIAVPLGGWLVASLYPALDLFGVLSLPPLTAPDASPDKAEYAAAAGWHATGAFLILGLAGVHVAAALYHLLVRRDGVFFRMWPGRGR